MVIANVLFGLSEAEAAYREVKINSLVLITWSVGVSLATIFILIRMMKAYNSIKDSETGRVDIKALMNLLYPLLLTQFVIMGGPALILGLEELFAYMERTIMGQTNNSATKPLWDSLKQELVDKATSSTVGLFRMDLGEALDYIGIMIVKPLVMALDHWIFALACSGRYLYLLLLELVSPIALVCLLGDEKVQQTFYTWAKNLFCCFLLLPAFCFANVFAEAIKTIMIEGGTYTTIALIMVLIAKLTLYKVAANYVFKLL